MNSQNNLYNIYRSIAETYCDRLKLLPRVMGICLLGGIAKRKYIDRFSDIDIAVFSEKRDDLVDLPPFSFTIKKAGKFIEFNLSQHAYETETADMWNEKRIAAYQNAEIYYDRDGALLKLLNKYVYGDHPIKEKIVRNINLIWWKGVYHSYAAIQRKSLLSAALLINEALKLSAETFLLLENIFGLHEKWIEANLLTNYPNESFVQEIKLSLILKDLSEDSLLDKIKLISKLRKKLITMACNKYETFPENHYKFWAEKISNRQIGTGNQIITILQNLEYLTPIEYKKVFGAMCYALYPFVTPEKVITNLRMDRTLSEDLLNKVSHILRGQS